MVGTVYSRTVSGKDGKKDFKVYNIKLTGKDGVPRFFNARFSKAVPDNGGAPLQVEIDANNVKYSASTYTDKTGMERKQETLYISDFNVIGGQLEDFDGSFFI